MTTLNSEGQTAVQLVRTFPASRSKVFKAWTDPKELRQWWKLGDGWRVTIVEVDLRVGGPYRIRLESTHGDSDHTVTGSFREVKVPEKLVYTWVVSDPKLGDEESIVTVEFHERGSSTEIVVTHERLKQKDSRESTRIGWESVLNGLAKLFANSPGQ